MQTLKTITFFGTVSNPATSRTSKNGRHYSAFGVSILDSNRQTFHYNVVAFGKQGQLRQQTPEGHPHQARHPSSVSAR